MWASTLCPLSSSTLKKAFGRDSTTVPSISMAPSFLGMSSAFRYPVPPHTVVNGVALLLILSGLPGRLDPRRQDRYSRADASRHKRARRTAHGPTASLRERVLFGELNRLSGPITLPVPADGPHLSFYKRS